MKGLRHDLKEKVLKLKSEGLTRREIADQIGVDVKKIHNFFNNLRISQRRKAAPKQDKIKIQKLEIKDEKEDTKVKAKSEKTMVIITSDISMLKKLIGEL